MIPCSGTDLKTGRLQQPDTDTFTDLQEFLRYLELDHLWNEERQKACQDFPFRVSRHYAGLMKKGEPKDPLLRQVMPSARELATDQACSKDPLQDTRFHEGNGILRKYHGRALIITTGACAVNCRYCFRRHFPYQDHRVTRRNWQKAAEQLAVIPDINEIILSGGDPLSLSNNQLAELLHVLLVIPQLKRLRIHTRLPVMRPNRIDKMLVSILQEAPLNNVLVIHANHAREISPELMKSLQMMKSGGITLLNQAVLLKGVNDTLEAQINLCETLFSAGVLPYYLHQMDKVTGATHFVVNDKRALDLQAELLARLPGYLVPRLVVEKPGAVSKLSVADAIKPE